MFNFLWGVLVGGLAVVVFMPVLKVLFSRLLKKAAKED